MELGKAFDRVPREVKCFAQVQKQMARLVAEMYDGATTRVRIDCGVSAEFPVTVGQH